MKMKVLEDDDDPLEAMPVLPGMQPEKVGGAEGGGDQINSRS